MDEILLVARFDGSARVKRKGGAYSAIIWKLPQWTIVAATSEFLFAPDLTVNEVEYRGFLLSFDLLAGQARRRVITCGESSLVIHQMRGKLTVRHQDCYC